MITQQRLKELLIYNPDSGIFTWVGERGGKRVSGRKAGSDLNGYIRISICYKDYLVHRLAWLYVHGMWPSKNIDHINGNPGDNRICNLREASQAENLQNQKMPRSNNKASRFIGVSKRINDKKWVAKICLNKTHKYLGRFDTEEEAHAAYVNAKRTLHEFGTL